MQYSFPWFFKPSDLLFVAALLGDVRVHALSDFLAGYNRSSDNVGSMKLRLKLIP